MVIANPGSDAQFTGWDAMIFRDRTEAAQKLALNLKRRAYRDPLLLAIPRGGVMVGATLAEEIGAELDVILVRKLGAPQNPELAIGAVSEDGTIVLNGFAKQIPGVTPEYIAQERERQLAELTRRRAVFRAVRPPAAIAGRSIIVTDDGMATGSTMMAALEVVRAAGPHEIIVALPVLPGDRVNNLAQYCDQLVYLVAPSSFRAVGQFYEEFSQLSDEEVTALFRQALEGRPPFIPTTTSAS
jgi:predicted phosphoribosyltransferase